jgi:hypothetical protein
MDERPFPRGSPARPLSVSPCPSGEWIIDSPKPRAELRHQIRVGSETLFNLRLRNVRTEPAAACASHHQARGSLHETLRITGPH